MSLPDVVFNTAPLKSNPIKSMYMLIVVKYIVSLTLEIPIFKMRSKIYNDDLYNLPQQKKTYR